MLKPKEFRVFLMTIILGILGGLSPTPAYSQGINTQHYNKVRPTIELPLRVYTLEFEQAETLNAKTRGSQIPEIIHELNKIYERAGIRFKLLSGGPFPIKASKLTYYDGLSTITKDSQSIRYRLSKSIGNITPRGEYRIYMLKNFPKGEVEAAYYDPYLRAVFFAEHTDKYGKSHTGLLAQELGLALGLSRVEISNNMMFRRRPKNNQPDNNKLVEQQILRARQMAQSELDAGQRLKEQKEKEPLDPSKPKSIFDRP